MSEGREKGAFPGSCHDLSYDGRQDEGEVENGRVPAQLPANQGQEAQIGADEESSPHRRVLELRPYEGGPADGRQIEKGGKVTLQQGPAERQTEEEEAQHHELHRTT